MKTVCVVGMGYIGLPTAVVAAQHGWRVIGVDVDQQRVDAIAAGDPVIEEPDIHEALSAALDSGRLSVSTMPAQADYFVLAVPTPFKDGKHADLAYVFSAAQSIASVLKAGDTVILESTVPVRTTQRVGTFLEQETGLKLGVKLFVAHCPERVLPGKILKELVENDRIIGALDDASMKKADTFYRSFVTGSMYLTDAVSAEMVKLVENSYRDVNIAFAHQVASMAYSAGLDPYSVIDLANKHPRVNILNPTCGAGGHCIAVDPYFLIESFPAHTQLLDAARQVNNKKPLEIVRFIHNAALKWNEQNPGKRANVLLCGLAYKPDVDDFRESPALQIAQSLVGADQFDVSVSEPYARTHTLTGVPHAQFERFEDGVAGADVVVFLVAHTQFKAAEQEQLQGKVILDFCGIWHADRSYKKIEVARPLFWPASGIKPEVSQVVVSDDQGADEEHRL